MKKVISCLCIITLLISCTKKESSIGDNSLLRYVKHTNTTELNATQDEAFIYNNDVLKTVIGNSSLQGVYESNALGQITKVTNGDRVTTYTYYEDGKLKERNNFIDGVDQNSPVKFSYNGLIVTAILEREALLFNNKVEFTLNNSGKVIRKKTYNEDGDGYKELSNETFSYDASENISRHAVNNNDNPSQDSSTNYTYSDIKNPYYYAFKETYHSIYLDFFFNSFNITDKIGFCPNLQNNSKIVYKQNNGFPTKSTNIDTNYQIEYTYY